eukprot:2553548-Karenia_brevis.AAC.1
MDWVIQRFHIIFYHLRKLKVRPEKYQAAIKKCSPDNQKTTDEMLALIIKEWKENTAEWRERRKR